MLGYKKKKKTGTQIAQEFGDSIATKMKIIRKRNLPLKVICISCIIIFSLSILFGFYGLASCYGDISRKKQNIEKFKTELASLEKQLKASCELKEKLISDSITIEAVARSYGMSKKGEKVFYFLD
ncbi:MAG: septum formation initiator family protein [Fibromonadaceae bacterium]|jgi:cell division protein FtsB|nr:septum formation initiator family protein [Fibromonadaceae bacterium]